MIRGAFSTIFSLLTFAISVFFACVFCTQLSNILISIPFLYDVCLQAVQNVFNCLFGGFYSTINQFLSTIFSSSTPFFGNLRSILSGVEIDKSLSAGEICGEKFTEIFFQISAFVIIFLCSKILMKIIMLFCDNFIEKMHISSINRILGGALGVVRACFFVAVLYVVLEIFSCLTNCESVVNFLTNSYFSNLIFDFVRIKIIDLIL